MPSEGYLRSLAVLIVDAIQGHTIEFSNAPAVHGEMYDSVERILLSSTSVADRRAHRRIQELLKQANGGIFTAFDRQDCGITHRSATEFIYGSNHFRELPEEHQGRALGLALGFAMVAVETDREKR